MISESSGMMASLLSASFEAFVMDNEMLSLVHRCIRGIEVNEETLNIDSIVSAVTGSGHFIDQDQTMVSMERDYFYPTLAYREEPAVWQEQGGLDHYQRARVRVAELLHHHPNYIPKGIDQAIRANLPIKLAV